MKKSQLIPIALLSLISIMSCGNIGTIGNASDEKGIDSLGQNDS